MVYFSPCPMLLFLGALIVAVCCWRSFCLSFLWESSRQWGCVTGLKYDWSDFIGSDELRLEFDQHFKAS